MVGFPGPRPPGGRAPKISRFVAARGLCRRSFHGLWLVGTAMGLRGEKNYELAWRCSRFSELADGLDDTRSEFKKLELTAN
jgi:hypothetical protein